MSTVDLAGCRPEPIGSYLKALGTLRLVAEQVDAGATGWWDGDRFVLSSALDEAALVEYLRDQYRPTPILSPWNSDSGFKQGTSTATKTLLAVEASDDQRLAAYRETIAVVRSLRDDRWDSLSKEQRVALLRNRLPDGAVAWLDAAIVLRPERPAFPALLGAGGNFGRQELSPGFMGRILVLFDQKPKARAQSAAWLRAALIAEGYPPLRDDAVGQFDPGSAGGARSDAVGTGAPLTNPWDFVLLIEGSLVWASGVARRLGGSTSSASVPFSVAPSPVGHGSLARGERAKAELWAPLWDAPLDLARVERLFAEGRISWAGRQARNGVDAVRAVRTLGVDAGVRSFVRHVVSERMGQSPLAVPMGRIDVSAQTVTGVSVLGALDPWIDRLRRAASDSSAPQALVDAAHRADRALFAASTGRPADLQQLLVAISHAESTCGRTERGRTDGSVPPVPWLPAQQWVPLLDDGTPELRLAVALGTASDPDAGALGLLRTILRPITADRRGSDPFGALRWSRGEPAVGGLGARPLAHVLAECLVRRSERDIRARIPGEWGPWFPRGAAPGRGDAEAMAGGEIDLTRLTDLVGGCLVLRANEPVLHQSVAGDALATPRPAWRVLAPFYARRRTGGGDSSTAQPVARPTWARALYSGSAPGVIADALLRWALLGSHPVYDRRAASTLALGVDTRLLATALLAGAHPADVRAAGAAVCPDPIHQNLPEGEAT